RHVDQPEDEEGEIRGAVEGEDRGRAGRAERGLEDVDEDRDQERDHAADGELPQALLPAGQRVEALRREAEGGEEPPPGGADLGAQVEAPGHQPPSGVRSPRRPSGRKTRVRIRITKMIVDFQSEPGVNLVRPSLKFSIRPMRIAPRTAPGRLPIPPITAAVKAKRPRRKPVSNWTFVAKRA